MIGGVPHVLLADWRFVRSQTKIRLYQTYIVPVLLYGCETWSTTKLQCSRIDAFDMWTLRKIPRIPFAMWRMWKSRQPPDAILSPTWTLANRTLAFHLPGGRQLFVTTGGALWTQQRSSGVCYERKKTIPPTLPGEPILQWSGSLAVTSCWTFGFSRHRATRHQCDRHQWTFCYDCTTEKTRVIDQWGGEKLLLLSHDTGIWWNPSAVSCIRLHVKYSLLHLRYWMLTLSTALYCFFFFFLNMSAPVYDWQSVAKLKSSVTQFLITISECVNVRRYTFCDSVLAAQ